MRDGYRVKLVGIFCAMIFVMHVMPNAAQAQSVWTGQSGDDSLWSNDDNWDAAAPDPNNTGSLTFSDSPLLGPVADGQPWEGIVTLLFDNDAEAFNISGETLVFNDGEIVNDSGELQIFSNNITAGGTTFTLDSGTQTLQFDGTLELGTGLTMTATGTGTTELNDTVTGDGDIFLDDAATLTLNAANTYTGGTTIGPDSTLILGDDDSLGTGDLTVAGTGTASLQGEAEVELVNIANNVNIGTDSLLQLNGDAAIVLDGDVTGDGGLIADTSVILRGDNTYVGGTELLADSVVIAGSETAFGTGTIQVTGSSVIAADLVDGEAVDARTIANDVAIDADETLGLVGETSMILDGVISGDGGLIVEFTVQEEDEEEELEEINPVLTLNQANTYTGGTLLRSGTVELGDDAAFSTGDVTVNGLINLDTDDNRVIANNLVILGEDDGEDNDSILVVAGEHDYEFTGAFEGSGDIDFRLDDSTATLTGNSENFAGLTRVFDGTTVQLDGTHGGDLHSEAIIQGEGTVTGELRNFNGGVVAPGNSIGTMNVQGDYTQLAGSTLEVEIDVNAGTADLLIVGGDVQLAANSTIDVTRLDATPLTLGDTFDIIQAEGTIVDDGVDIVDDGSEVLLRLIGQITQSGSDQLYQLVASSQVFDFDAEGSNNLAVASGLNSLNVAGASTPVQQFLADMIAIGDAAAYNQALEDLSPGAYQAVDLVAIDNAHIYTSNVRDYLSARRRGGPIMAGLAMSQASPVGASLDEPNRDQRRLSLMLDEQGERDAGTGRGTPRRIAGERVGRGGQRGGFGEDRDWGVFGQAVGGIHDASSDTYRSGHSARVFGGQFGVDRNLDDQLTLGLGFSYLRSDVDLNGNRGEFEGDTFRVGPYLGWTDARNKWFIDASLTYGFHDIDSERYIPEQDATASGSFNAHEVLFYAGTGYPINMNGFTLTPRASLQYLYLEHDGFTESGAGAADLQVHSRDAQSLRTRLGASIGRYFHAGTVVVQPELFLGWEYEALGDDDLTANFAAGGDAFSVTPSAPGRNAAALAASVNFLFDERLSAFFRYEGRLSGDNDSHGLGAGFSLRF